jgi:ATP-dependent Lon protease
MSKLSAFEVKKLKIKCIKLKYRHSLLVLYEKFYKSNYFGNNKWVDVLRFLISKNNLNLDKHQNEFLVLDSGNSKEIYDSSYYILSLVHQEVLSEFLNFVLNNSKKFKTFLSESIATTLEEIEKIKFTLNDNKSSMFNFDDFTETEVYNDFINYVLSLHSESIDNDIKDSKRIPQIQLPSINFIIANMNDMENDYDYENDGDGDDEHEEYDEEDYEIEPEEEKNRKKSKKKDNNSVDQKFKELLSTRNKKTSSIIEEFKNLQNEEKTTVVEQLSEINKDLGESNNLCMRVLRSNLSIHEKKELLGRVETQINEKRGKFKEYCEQVLTFPFGKYKKMSTENLKTPEEVNKLLKSAKTTLDEAIYGHDEAKHTILTHIAQMISNPDSSGKVIGIKGSKGCGKTSLVEQGFCKILGLPFVLIGLAGLTDGTFFTGHNYTYEGSQPGKIVEGIKKAGCLNPVFFCDELDKISSSDRGKEISNKLIQLVDPVQNNHFQDAYFGNIDIDLSKAHWIFTWNDSSKIDPILLDRIKVIKTKGFNLSQKLIISNNYLIPRIIKDVGIKNNINISDEVIKYLIGSLTFEAGVRKLKELLFEIVSEFNMKTLTGGLEPPKKKRKSEKKEIFNVTMDNVNDFLVKKIPYEHIKIRNENTVGNIVGLYATTNELGGIIPIETRWIPTDTILSLNLTGNLGKVMKESSSVAKTIAWERTSNEIKDKLMDEWNNKKKKSGIHIHCCEASIAKEGPSAGCALAVCIYSLFNEIPIKHDIGITGELNLSGDVLPIGGLCEKMNGAKLAGCKMILYPEKNTKDYNQAIKDCPDIIDDNFKAFPIKNFDEALKYLLCEK